LLQLIFTVVLIL